MYDIHEGTVATYGALEPVYATRLLHHIHVDTDVALLYTILCKPTYVCKAKMKVAIEIQEGMGKLRCTGRAVLRS